MTVSTELRLRALAARQQEDWTRQHRRWLGPTRVCDIVKTGNAWTCQQQLSERTRTQHPISASNAVSPVHTD